MHSFKSIDCVTNEEATNYPIEFLNSLDVPGLLPHNLRLKVGSVVIMLRNINQPKLCNGTRSVVRKLMNNVIYATILKGKFKDVVVDDPGGDPARRPLLLLRPLLRAHALVNAPAARGSCVTPIHVTLTTVDTRTSSEGYDKILKGIGRSGASGVRRASGADGRPSRTLTCWNRAFLCLGLASSGCACATGCCGVGSSNVCGKLTRDASDTGPPAPVPASPERLAREPSGDVEPCEPFAHSVGPSPDALLRTPLYSGPGKTLPPPRPVFPPAHAPPPPLPSRGFTYKFDESLSHAMSPSEGKGCVRHDANVSAT
ncbi:hypothetical protein EVAR_38723_1 [Eumeta japonica]|uniref:DNA helicase Pif1-like 2B domain-containing protein n=1 Tax=Eumeta variegata TaxID=151549 RepID=A0A4C1YS25_EUMVA|nr:hypothetical protein EVAR_38723_1 [Eumeta japonica]